MFRQVADIQTQAMLKLPVPDLRGGKPTVISAPCSPELKQIVQSLVERAEALRTGQVDPREDNMLLVTTDGRKAALDLRLARSAPARPSRQQGQPGRGPDRAHLARDRRRALGATGLLRPVRADRRQGLLGL